MFLGDGRDVFSAFSDQYDCINSLEPFFSLNILDIPCTTWWCDGKWLQDTTA